MRPVRIRHPLVIALVLLVAAACTDATAPASRGIGASAPRLQSDASEPTYVAKGKVLHRTQWSDRDITVGTYITPDRGGTLTIRSAGLKVSFPKGAVSQTTYVWVTAFGGNKVVYDFGPHGTQFNVAIQIEQDLKNTKAYQNVNFAHELFGGYTPKGQDDISADGTVRVSETFRVELVPEQKRIPRLASFSTTHFSGYVLATGRATVDVSSEF